MMHKGKDKDYVRCGIPFNRPIRETTDIKPLPPTLIADELMRATLTHYNINPLYQYLCNVLGQEATDTVFRNYQVGTANKWNGSTVFWQIDKDNHVRTGKIMAYNPKNGHRIKEPNAYVSWVHSEMHLKDFHLKQCLFGEHLLSDYPANKVILVESEKTCLIASHFMPDYLWLATGGKNGCFNLETMQVLRGRDIILMPDLGATQKWKEKAEMLRPICKSVMVSDVLEQMATEAHRDAGLDIADFLLMEETKQMTLARMIQHNPAIGKLVNAFGLKIVEDD